MRLAGETEVKGEDRGSFPNFVSLQAKHLWEGGYEIRGDLGEMLEEEHPEEAEGAVSMVQEVRAGEGRIESCWNPKMSILQHETWVRQTRDGIAKPAVQGE